MRDGSPAATGTQPATSPAHNTHLATQHETGLAIGRVQPAPPCSSSFCNPFTTCTRHLLPPLQEMGLAFDEWDLDYYTNMFRDELKRDPTNVELFDIAQSNSEHSRCAPSGAPACGLSCYQPPAVGVGSLASPSPTQSAAVCVISAAGTHLCDLCTFGLVAQPRCAGGCGLRASTLPRAMPSSLHLAPPSTPLSPRAATGSSRPTCLWMARRCRRT